MKSIKLTYGALFIVLAGLWLAADELLAVPYQFFALRASMVNLTGILALGAMSVGVVLALRPVRLEPLLGGLDKGYRLHKWLGITALVLGIIHWLWAKGPKWAVGWGWLERPVRAPAPEEPLAILRFFHSQRHLAEGIGEWTFYAAVLLIVLALSKRFPYRHFFKTHRLLALVYLLLAFHGLVLMKFSYWGALIGPVMAVLMLGGVVAALTSLAGRIGQRHQALGEIEGLTHRPASQVLSIDVRLRDRWPGHQAGQFAFVTFDPGEGPHPFTISSAWKGDGHMRFHVKAAGDYTGTLPQTLKLGQLARVEGPYGRFDFQRGNPRQIWVAGGIGITPFLARLQVLAHLQERSDVDLFFSTRVADESALGKLRQMAERAGVRLHLMLSQVDGRLNAQRLTETVADWQRADVWFCGPAGFGQTLRADLAAKGLPPDRFHQELFEMR